MSDLAKDDPTLNWPALADYCCMPEELFCSTDCCCGSTERVLHAYQDQRPDLPLMTVEQRLWCVDQIRQVEGRVAIEYADLPDALLAGEVLVAWTDYCKDKGLIA